MAQKPRWKPPETAPETVMRYVKHPLAVGLLLATVIFGTSCAVSVLFNTPVKGKKALHRPGLQNHRRDVLKH
jgi:hypothetical protein